MARIVYEVNGRRILRKFRTLAEAITFVAGDVNKAISPEHTNAEVERALPGFFYSTGGTILEDFLTPATIRVRAALHKSYNYLSEFGASLFDSEVIRLTADKTKANDLMFRFHEAMFLVGDHANYTVDEKVAWATAMLTGASDVSDRATFYSVLASLPPPTHPITWVNPINAAVLTLADGVTLSGPGVRNLNMLSSQIPTGTQFANGAWIEAIVI